MRVIAKIAASIVSDVRHTSSTDHSFLAHLESQTLPTRKNAATPRVPFQLSISEREREPIMMTHSLSPLRLACTEGTSSIEPLQSICASVRAYLTLGTIASSAIDNLCSIQATFARRSRASCSSIHLRDLETAARCLGRFTLTVRGPRNTTDRSPTFQERAREKVRPSFLSGFSCCLEASTPPY